MEEKIYERQITKLSISCRVIDEQQIDRHFSRNEIAELYTFNQKKPSPEIPKLPKVSSHQVVAKHPFWPSIQRDSSCYASLVFRCMLDYLVLFHIHCSGCKR